MDISLAYRGSFMHHLDVYGDKMESSSQDVSKIRLRGSMDGTKPITDRDSKMVMLRAERGDRIDVVQTVGRFQQDLTIPDELEIQRRVSTYHGTELLMEPASPGVNEKYLLTAPGPDSYLFIWSSETDSEGYREKWSVLGEIKAQFSDDLPRYPICEDCGEAIKSLEHERLAAADSCPGADT